MVRNLTRSGVGVLLMRTASFCMRVLIGIALARWLGAAEFGRYEFIVSVITLTGLVATIGIPNVVLRETAALTARQQGDHLSGLLLWSLVLVSTLTVAVVSFVGLVTLVISDSAMPTMKIALIVGVCSVVPQAITNVLSQYLRGFHFTLRGMTPELVRQFLILCVLLVAIYYFGATGTALVGTSILLVSAVCALVVAMVLVCTFVPMQLSMADALSGHKVWIRMALPFALIGGVHLINNRADILVLGLMVAPNDVGVYAVAMRLAELVLFVPIAINITITSSVAQLYAEKNNLKLEKLVRRAVAAQTMCAIPVVAVITFFGADLVGWLFGEEYSGGISVLWVLLVGHVTNIVLGPADVILNMSGFEKVTARALAFASIGNVALNLTLIPILGIIGAALATSVTAVVWNTLLAIYARRVLGIDTTIFRSDVWRLN